jgi:hypothetical protein|nr:MAG TPA: hypothetical protein [Caudoviricetes sp.]
MAGFKHKNFKKIKKEIHKLFKKHSVKVEDDYFEVKITPMFYDEGVYHPINSAAFSIDYNGVCTNI